MEFQTKLTPKTKETTMQIRTTQTTTLTDQIKTTMQISVTQTIGSIPIADRITVKSNYEVILWDGSTDRLHSTKRRSENDYHTWAKRNSWLSLFYSLKRWIASAMISVEKSLFGAIENQKPMRDQSKPRRLFYVDVNHCSAVNKEMVRSFPSSRRRCIKTHKMEMIAPNNCDEKTKNAEIAGFLRRSLLTSSRICAIIYVYNGN